MKKSIFKASFYESRRLRHEGFLDYMVLEIPSKQVLSRFRKCLGGNFGIKI